MKAVKPYYISGYRNRLFYNLSQVNSKRYDKILPFLPVVLFVAFPFFFYVDEHDAGFSNKRLIYIIQIVVLCKLNS